MQGFVACYEATMHKAGVTVTYFDNCNTIVDLVRLRCGEVTAWRMCLFTLTAPAVAVPSFLEASQVVKCHTVQGQN